MESQATGRRCWPWALAAALVALATFAPTLWFGFVNWDDPDLIIENPRVVAASPVELFAQPGVAYLPVRDLAWNLVYRVAGARPVAYHLLNVALHALATALFCVLVARLFAHAPPFVASVAHDSGKAPDPVGSSSSSIRTPEGIGVEDEDDDEDEDDQERRGSCDRDRECRAVVAGVAALVFAVHPLHVEPVAWVSGMKDPLSAALMLGSFVLALRALGEQGRGRRLLVSVGALVLFWLAALAKSSALVLPLLMALYAITLAPERKRALKLLVPFVVTAAVLAGLALVVGRASGAVKARTDSAATVTLTTTRVATEYLRSLVLPTGLSPRYPAVKLRSLADGRAVVGLVVVALYAGLAVWAAWRRHRRLLFAMGWLVVALLPYLGIVPTSTPRADRYAYVAVGGLAMALGLAAEAVVGGWWAVVGVWKRRIIVAAGVIVIGAYAATAAWQSGFWRSSERLWRRALTIAPNDPLAHYLMGDVIWERKPLAAARHFQRAADIRRHAAGNHWAEAGVARERDNADLTELHVAMALEQERLAADALAYLGTAWLHADASPRSKGYQAHREALLLSRGEPRFYYLVATDLAEQGRVAEALTHYEAAARGPTWLREQVVADLEQLGRELVKAGKVEQAKAVGKAVLSIKRRERERETRRQA